MWTGLHDICNHGGAWERGRPITVLDKETMLLILVLYFDWQAGFSKNSYTVLINGPTPAFQCCCEKWIIIDTLNNAFSCLWVLWKKLISFTDVLVLLFVYYVALGQMQILLISHKVPADDREFTVQFNHIQ